jgi:hypothetical protein
MEREREERIRKLKRDAMNFKLDLHDLSEELPLGWERIMEVATRTYQAHKELSELQAQG